MDQDGALQVVVVLVAVVKEEAMAFWLLCTMVEVSMHYGLHTPSGDRICACLIFTSGHQHRQTGCWWR